MTKRQMKFCVFMMGCGHYHDGGWKLPGSYTDLASNFERWNHIARRIEAAKIDGLFIADLIGALHFDDQEVFTRSPRGNRMEPLTLLSALASVTKQLGLIGTVATSYAQPYDVARQFASLDMISGGRAGWNVVTGASPADAAQYGDTEYAAPEARYARGEEFVDVVTELWGSVEPGAFIHDAASGIYAVPEKLHYIDHHGTNYSVKGPLSIGPSPQGRPVLVQAGQSEAGRALAARVADVVFTAQNSLDRAAAFYADIRARAAAFGRDPDQLKIMPGIVPIVGRTPEEADEKERALNDLIDPSVGFAKLHTWLHGIDLTKYPLDEPFPDLPPSATQGRGANYVEMARAENLTLRQVFIRASISNAHLTIKGTPETICDTLQNWFEGGAADGFNLLCTSFPAGLDDFLDQVLPALQRRGLFRTEYEGATLRANLGLNAA